jgi:hypothetical protein
LNKLYLDDILNIYHKIMATTMKTKILLLCFCLNCLATKIEPQNQVEQWISVTANGHQLAGLMMDNDQATTALLIVAGSGPTDHNGNVASHGMINNSYKMLATELHHAGYAVLRFDKHGIGKSAYDEFDMSKVLFSDYVNDVVVLLEYLQKQYPQVVVIGHSLGGLMAIEAAQKSPVSRIITLASVADSGYKTLKRQMLDQPEFIRDAAIPLLDRLALGETIPADEVPAFLNALLHPSLQPYLKSFILIEPRAELAQLSIPTLNIIGDTDIQVEVSETQMLSEGLEHAKIKIINGMNHVLKNAPKERNANLATYSQADLPLHEALIPVILNFLQSE